jgi:hypothetical protein
VGHSGPAGEGGGEEEEEGQGQDHHPYYSTQQEAETLNRGQRRKRTETVKKSGSPFASRMINSVPVPLNSRYLNNFKTINKLLF